MSSWWFTVCKLFLFFFWFNDFSTLPAKYLEKIAEQMRTNNINALMVIGGFEVH